MFKTRGEIDDHFKKYTFSVSATPQLINTGYKATMFLLIGALRGSQTQKHFEVIVSFLQHAWTKKRSIEAKP